MNAVPNPTQQYEETAGLFVEACATIRAHQPSAGHHLANLFADRGRLLAEGVAEHPLDKQVAAVLTVEDFLLVGERNATVLGRLLAWLEDVERREDDADLVEEDEEPGSLSVRIERERKDVKHQLDGIRYFRKIAAVGNDERVRRLFWQEFSRWRLFCSRWDYYCERCQRWREDAAEGERRLDTLVAKLREAGGTLDIPREHPEVEALVRYFYGESSGEELEYIQIHLIDCKRCEGKLEMMTR